MTKELIWIKPMVCFNLVIETTKGCLMDQELLEMINHKILN